MDAYPGLAWWFVLPAAVWVVYTLDHLVDDWERKHPGLFGAMTYHSKYRLHLLAAVLILSAVLILVSWLWLDRRIFYFGLFLGGVIAIYIALIYLFRKRKDKVIVKKLLISLAYTLGIWGAPIVLAGELNQYQMLIILLFWLMALANTYLYTLFERANVPLKDAKDSTEKAFSGPAAKFIKLVLFLAVLIAFLSLWLFEDYPYTFLYALALIILMDLSMFLIQTFSQSFSRSGRYKPAIELVFLLPFLIVFS